MRAGLPAFIERSVSHLGNAFLGGRRRTLRGESPFGGDCRERTPRAGHALASKAETAGYDAHLLADIEQFQALGIDIFEFQSRCTPPD